MEARHRITGRRLDACVAIQCAISGGGARSPARARWSSPPAAVRATHAPGGVACWQGGKRNNGRGRRNRSRRGLCRPLCGGESIAKSNELSNEIQNHPGSNAAILQTLQGSAGPHVRARRCSTMWRHPLPLVKAVASRQFTALAAQRRAVTAWRRCGQTACRPGRRSERGAAGQPMACCGWSSQASCQSRCMSVCPT